MEPVCFDHKIQERIVSLDQEYKQFLESKDSGKQFNILKRMLDCTDLKEKDIHFVCLLFCEIPSKHPIKCFLVRFLNKNVYLHDQFENALKRELLLYMEENNSAKYYYKTIGIIMTCTENFPVGADVLECLQQPLNKYLAHALEYSINTIKKNSLPPSERTSLFSQIHNICRVILYGLNKLNGFFQYINTEELYTHLQYLMSNSEVPMDTKSICGILFITLHRKEKGDKSLIEIATSLDDSAMSDCLRIILISSLFTVLTFKELNSMTIIKRPAIIVLCENITAISERSTESFYILSSMRTILSLSKMLEEYPECDSTLVSVVETLSAFVWTHIDHYMDSVRHLCVQILRNIVRSTHKITAKQPDTEANIFEHLIASVLNMNRDRKVYFIGINALIVELGAKSLLQREPMLISHLIESLLNPAVQANVSTVLESLLLKHVKEESAETIYRLWIEKILDFIVSTPEPREGSMVSVTLENLIALCVSKKPQVVNEIHKSLFDKNDKEPVDIPKLKAKLICANVIRKTGSMVQESERYSWTNSFRLESLMAAMTHPDDEIRLLALSLTVDTPKTTELLSEYERQLSIWFLRYNINAQSPSFRQKTLALITKLLNRYKNGMEVLIRNNTLSECDYGQFVLELREFCVGNLIPGSNYSRRTVTLHILQWIYEYEDVWKTDNNLMEEFNGVSQTEKKLAYVLLSHVRDDNFESNKKLALDILSRPAFKGDFLSFDMVIEKASSIKPIDCVTAAYELEYLLYHRDHSLFRFINDNESNTEISHNDVIYYIMKELLRLLQRQLECTKKSILNAAANGPMYGLVYCIRHLYQKLNIQSISDDLKWTQLICQLIDTLFEINKSVECVVNNSSPEGHLPMDFESGQFTIDGTLVQIGEEAKVSAQMVLLCAWRSVKEVSLLLSEVSSRTLIQGESGASGNITWTQMLAIGEHFTQLLSETKHRGAFEQAYVGFNRLCSRLWKCKSMKLHTLPQRWLEELMEAVQNDNKSGKLCATRRSAGVPFMIQALVTTEMELNGSAKCFESCMSTLLRLASDTKTANEETRTHCLNILRALYRHTKLGEVVYPYVADGLLTAIKGFDRKTWAERNSSTLLFSSLMVRIFGVQRSKDSDKLCHRNKMSGRVFFLRYPRLYDFMLNILRDVSAEKENELPRPSLYPVLLLLARLYPSSLEGTASNLKLVDYIPHILACAGSSVLKTRQLAAKAIVSLVSPENYVDQICSLLAILGDVHIKNNFCHGIILQIISLLNNRPPEVILKTKDKELLSNRLNGSLWIVDKIFSGNPCYVIIESFLKMINIILWRFTDIEISDIMVYLEGKLFKLFDENSPLKSVYYGIELFLKSSLYLYMILLLKKKNYPKFCKVLIKQMKNKYYEVNECCMDVAMLIHEEDSMECFYLNHVKCLIDPKLRKILSSSQEYIDNLRFISDNTMSLECKRKAEKLLSFEPNSYEIFFNEDLKQLDDGFDTWMEKISANSETVLICLNDFLRSKKLDNGLGLTVLKHLYKYSSAENELETRAKVVDLLNENKDILFLDHQRNIPHVFLEYNSYWWAISTTLIEDDDPEIRQRMSDLILEITRNLSYDQLVQSPYRVIPSVMCEVMIELIKELYSEHETNVILLVLALLNFNAEVNLTDEDSECRVFDQNERHNIFLEESKWTAKCVQSLQLLNAHRFDVTFIVDLIRTNEVLFKQLCSDNVEIFKDIIHMEDHLVSDVINPKLKWLKCSLNRLEA